MKKLDLQPIIVTVLVAFLLQIIFISSDAKETPDQAAVEFTKAYFGLDQEKMYEHMSESRKIVSGVDIVDEYIHKKAGVDAKERGLSSWYLKDKIYHVNTWIVHQDDTSAQIHLKADRKPPLKSFFTKETYKPVDQVINLVKEGGMWKVSGKLLSLSGN